jgi:type II secretory pathway pseudopilin PulG
MLRHIKNTKMGFTLIEIVVALGIIVILSGLTITTISAIPQARMRGFAQTIKSEFELARDFAKTHGGQAEFSLKKTDDGIVVSRTGENLIPEEQLLKDGNLVLFYKETGNDKEYELGIDDASDVFNNTLTMTFSQTQGAIIGPHMIDYIVISNGSKNFKMVIKQSTGMIYYDYELEGNALEQNIVNNDTTTVKIPTFVLKGAFVDTVEVGFTGSSVQPELNYDSRYIKINGVYRAVNPGTYEIVFSLKDPYSTTWSDGTIEDKKLIWKIV